MKRIYIFLALIISIFIQYGCDDSSVNIFEYRDNNIKFQPDSLYLKDNITLYTISFYGINFKKFKPDSIKIDNYKFDFKIMSDSLLNLYIKGVSGGYQDIHFYFPTRKMTLEKKIKIINSNEPPSENNLYFNPDTLIIDFSETFSTFYLYGINFFKNSIDSVFIGESKCQIGYKDISKLPIYNSFFQSGEYNVTVYYNGKKIVLKKKMTIINHILDFEILKFNKINFQINRLPILYQYSSYPAYRYDFSRSHGFTDIKKELIQYKYNLYNTFGITDFDFSIEFDSQYRIIKKLTSSRYERSSVHPPYQEQSYDLTLYNIPFNVKKYEDNKLELAIDINGEIINNYYPLITYRTTFWGGSMKLNDFTYGITKTKKDSITGREINFYPATDSSSIKIYLRNF
jgi:hypothetical protein